MTELDWEPAPSEAPPKVHIRRVNPWLGSALRDWNRACYPPRRGTTIIAGFGCFFFLLVLPWALFTAIKFFVWATGVCVALAYYPVHVTCQLVTYNKRYERVQLREWTKYMTALHGEDEPPDMIA